MPNSNKQLKTLTFQVDAALLTQLGEQLVARRSVALAELIKNSYDADATQATVTLRNVTKPNGTIIIADNGTGMTFETLKNNWMRIATTGKAVRPLSPIYCRPTTGAKGIGRFAVRRLAKTLTLESVASRPSGIREYLRVSFDWQKYFTSGNTLTDIPVTYIRKRAPANTPTGVTLRLDGVHESWDAEDAAELYRDLAGLISPFSHAIRRRGETGRECKRDEGFVVDFNSQEFPSLSGKLEDKFLEAAWAVLEGRVDRRGRAEYKLRIRETNETLTLKPSDRAFTTLAGVHLNIHYFVFRADLFKGSGFGVRTAQQIGREKGGVRLYLDGFRVFPYGDPGDDWLQLEQTKAGRIFPANIASSLSQLSPESRRPLFYTPGNNQLFGTIEISRLKHPGIIPNISRERLVETDSFYELREFAQTGIFWAVVQYARVKTGTALRDRLERTPEDIIKDAETKLTTTEGIPTEARVELLSLLSYAKEASRRQSEEQMSELALLRSLASLGTATTIFNHQLRAIVDGVRSIYTDLSEIKLQGHREASQTLAYELEKLKTWHRTLEQQVALLGSFFGEAARSRRRPHLIHNAVDEALQPFELYMRELGIHATNDVPKSLRTQPMYKAELGAILINAITNSIKALRASRVREVKFRAERKKGLLIEILDTGPGIELKRREEVFKPFVSSSTPDPILGEGTGIGLKVVQDLVLSYGGEARFVDTRPPWNTCLRITFPEK